MDREQNTKPLCVDLDGSLVRTDTLVESFFETVRRRPASAFFLAASLSRGKAGFKRAVARQTELSPEALPFNTDLLDYLRKEKANGRPLWLVTAANHRMADQVAAHLGIFDGVLSSNGSTNLSGEAKRAALVERFGPKGFVYVGNDRVDLHVWKDSDGAVVVNPPNGLVRRVSAVTGVMRVFDDRLPWFLSIVKLMRPHQWLKNLLLFAPVLLAHHLSDRQAVCQVVLAVIAFCFSSSAVYVMNDAVDIDADRHHQTKRGRPIASGAVSLPAALLLFVSLLMGSGALALFLPALFAGFIGGYVLLNVVYSLWLKKMVLLDVFSLSFMYIIRVYAGAAAGDVAVSDWFLSFCLFFFLGLALLKRVAELSALDDAHSEGPKRRGYRVGDRDQLARLGSASSFLSVLVLVLYINSPAVTVLYNHPLGLWSLCPLLLFWISRMWLKINRGEITQDPVSFASKDPVSYIIGFLVLLVLYFSA